MKKTSSMKKKGLLWLVLAMMALLAAAGVVLALILPGNAPDVQEQTEAKIYWNIDREVYRDPKSGMSTREAGEDGLYHIRMVLDGAQVEVLVADKQLVNFIDFSEVVALTVDADGIVVDVKEAKAVANEVAKDAFVQRLDGSTVTVNSSKAMNGMETVLQLNEHTGIYDVSSEAAVAGEATSLSLMDMVLAYANEAGEVTCMFVKSRAVEAEVYWRVDRNYDSNKGMTGRKPDENGVYTMLFAHDGQQVELKCKDELLVSEIDRGNNIYAEFAFVFDDEGYIAEILDVAQALIGKKLCNNYNITELDGNTFTAVRHLEGNVGASAKATIDADCDIFLVEDGCDAAFVGQRISELKMNDRITCYTDLEGKPLLIFVIRRTQDYPMYYNVTRMYDSAAKQTKRTPVNGWYELQMVGEGKERTLRTKDKALMDEIDSLVFKYMGLKLNGDVIEDVCSYACVCGWSSAGEGVYVDAISGNIVSLASASTWNLTNYVLGENCEIYDISGAYGVKNGTVAEVRLGDRVTGFKNAHGELTHLYITQRYQENAKIYYNLSRKYNSTTKETYRTKDEDGYYVFEMCCEGKEVTVKTKDMAVATYIDKENAPIVALEVKNGVIRNAYPAIFAIKNGKGKVANFNYVEKIEGDGTVTTSWTDNGKQGTSTFKMAKDCVVYNAGAYFINNRGEKTTLQKDDQIQAFATNPKGEVTLIYVMKRQLDAPLYWKVDRFYDSKTGKTTRPQDADGYYVFEMAVGGELKKFRTKDEAIATAIDKTTIAVTLRTKGDIILGAYTSIVAKNVRDTKPESFDITEISDGKILFTRNYPAATNYGATLELKIAQDCQFYDISEDAEQFGQKAEPGIGDRIYGFTNQKGELLYGYIKNRHTRQAGAVSLCDHCGKEVFWEPFNGGFHKADAHYYLTKDVQRGSQFTLGSENGTDHYEVVLDLNGKTYTAAKRGFLIYDNLTIMDSAGGGKLVSENAENTLGGCVMVIGTGKLNLYNVTLEQVTGRSNGALRVGATATCNIYGGSVTGGHIEAKGNGITLHGAPVIEKLSLDAGKTISLGELTQGAKIGVSVTGTFTAQSDKAEQYAQYFVPSGQYDTITTENGQLVYKKGEPPYVAPVIPEKINDDLIFIEGTTDAYCPACEKKVTWTAVTADGIGNAEDKAHYYLTEDIVYTGDTNFIRGPGTNKVACLHLNGHDLTAQNSYVVVGYAGVLNVMGNGIVSGNAKSTNYGAAIHINTSAPGGAVNLYGGTYVKPETNTTAAVVSIYNNGGTIFLYEGAAVEGDIYVGLANLRDALLVLMGGTVRNGTIRVTGANPEKGFKSNIGIVDSVVEAVEIAGNNTVVLSGAPVIGKLTLADGVKLTLGELEETASIRIAANGIFTEANDKAADYQKNFYCPGSMISVKDNALCCEKDYVSDLAFAEGSDLAFCPACGEQVQWKPLTGEAAVTLVQGDHYYLTDAVTYLGTDGTFLTAPAVGGTACLHLNGYDLTATGSRVITGGTGVLNVMGRGNVAGCFTGSGNNRGATIDTNNGYTTGQINLYSGTYKKLVQDVTHPIITTWNGGSVNLFKDAAVDGTGNTKDNVKSYYGSFNIYGGTVSGGSGRQVVVYDYSDTKVGTFTMTAGQVIGNITASGTTITPGTFTVSGGSITGDVNISIKAKATLSGAPVINKLILESGSKLILGELTDGAEITVKASGVFAEMENAADYVSFFKPAQSDYDITAQGDTLVYAKKEN